MIRARSIAAALALSLGGVGLAPAPAAAGTDARDLALEVALRTRRLRDVKFDDRPLEEVVQWLRIATGWNFVVRRAVIEKAGVDLSAARVKVELADVTVATFLGVVLEPSGLVQKVEGNVIFVTTKADALGKPVLVLYPVSHLTWTKTNFRGRDIDLHPSGYTPPDDEPEEQLVEDDPFTDPQHIVSLVKEMVDAPWDSEGWSISGTKVYLSVKAPRSVQRRVAVALEQMAALK